MIGSRVRRRLALALAVGLGALSLGACLHNRPSRLVGASACRPSDHYQRPTSPDDAARIAKRMLADLFGAPTMLRQEPYHAVLDQDRWVVRGTPPPGDAGAPFLVLLDTTTGCPVHLGRDE